MVGRDLELAELETLLAAIEEGAAGLAIAGEPGIGKTSLWAEGARRASQRGFLLLVARPAEIEMPLAYGALADLLEPAGDDVLAELPEPQREALDAASLRRRPGRRSDPRAVCAAWLTTLRALARERPVVVAVDDAHWLDRASARTLAYAARRLGDERVGLLVATRDELATAELLPARSRTCLLRPLDLADLRACLDAHLERSVTGPVLARIHRESGGNPFYAIEIARELGERQGAPTRDLPVPSRVLGLLRARFQRLPRRARDALLVASCLAAPTTGLVDERALAAAEEDRIVRVERDGRIRFTHPLLASAVYQSAASARRREVHRRLASQVEEAEERARHLALGSSRPDAAIARELDAAAELAHARGAPEAAAELAELALELTPRAAGDRIIARRVVAAAWRPVGEGPPRHDHPLQPARNLRHHRERQRQLDRVRRRRRRRHLHRHGVGQLDARHPQDRPRQGHVARP